MQEHFYVAFTEQVGYIVFCFLFFFYLKRRQELLDVALCNDKVNEGT